MRFGFLPVVACLLIATFGAPATAGPSTHTSLNASQIISETRSDRRQKLMKVLRQKEFPSEQKIRAVGADVDSILSSIINDKTLDQATRVRAVWCLKYFSNKRARLLVRSIVTDPMWLKPFKVAAVVAMGHTHGDEAIGTIREYCEDSDAELRKACVRSLGVIGGQAVLSFLRSMQVRERDPDILTLIDKLIKRISRPVYLR